jgi:TRAP transporter TAXI family solute receptor
MRKKVYQALGIVMFAGFVCTSFLSGIADAKDGWPKGIHITAPSQGPKYFAPLALAGVLEAETGMKVRLIPDEVNYQRLKSFKEGEFDIYVEGLGGALTVLQGKSENATYGNGPMPLRIMWPAVIEAFAPMLRGDSEFNTMADIKDGFSIAAPPGAPPQANCYCVAAWADTPKDKWKLEEYGSMGTAIDAVPNGEADMVWWIPDAGETVEAESKPKGLKWLELDPAADPEGAARAAQLCPQWMYGPAPEGSVESAKGKSVALVPTYFFVMEDMDADLVYKLVKFADENNDKVVKQHPTAASQSLEHFKTIVHGNLIPLHEGTVRYLKEKGVWTEMDQKRQDFNVKLGQKYIEAFDMAAQEARKMKIKPTADNEEWLKLWEQKKAELPTYILRSEFPQL